MSLPTSSASTSATPEPVIYQLPINVPLPAYDLNAPDQMYKFSASLILGFSFARSKLRNAWTTYSGSWARKVMQLWTVGS